MPEEIVWTSVDIPGDQSRCLYVWRPVGELLGDLAECLSECTYGYRETSMNSLLDVCLWGWQSGCLNGSMKTHLDALRPVCLHITTV